MSIAFISKVYMYTTSIWRAERSSEQVSILQAKTAHFYLVRFGAFDFGQLLSLCLDIIIEIRL